MPLGRKSGHTTSSAPSIHVVAHDRMADRREMNADLVSPSGMEMRTKKVPRVEPGKAYEVGLGRPTLIDDCHALPVSWITGYRLVYRKGVTGEMTPGHHGIAPHDMSGGDGCAQEAVRAVCLGDDDQAGGLLVQAMDHSRSLGLTLRREAPTASQQGVDQRPTPVAGRRVHYHPRGLIHHQQRFVLIDDTDWNVFPGNRPFLDLGDLYPDDFPWLRAVAGFLPPSIDQYVSLRDQSRRLCARELGPMCNKEIEADIAVRLDGKLSGVAQARSPFAYPTRGRPQPLGREIAPLPKAPTPGGRRQR